MSRSVCRNCSGRATAGSYSTSACSWVRLTATLSTPGIRPRAFSIVPVQREQCNPPMRARIFLRFGLTEGSSVHGVKVEAVADAMFIVFPRIVLRSQHGVRAASAWVIVAADHAKAGLLNQIDQPTFLTGLRIV